MNDQIEKKEETLADWTLSNILAAVGFVVLVILLAWLAIQFVRMIPSAWNSLADVFESNQRALEERTASKDDETNEDTDKEDDGSVVVVDTDEDFIDDEETEVETTDNTDTVATTSAPSVKPKPTTPTTPQYRTVTTYVVPTSNPNGYTDLEVSFVAIGKMTNDERFVPSASLSTEEHGAMQFRVKNIGTKTSNAWHFAAELPNGGEFNSVVQNPLKPGEVATLTISFMTDRKDGNRTLGASVNVDGDINTANNGFRATVNIR
ncbi:hypothetical protein A2392_01355 [Candidatus Kaiserbacteria bacterium RIFOXYB1_FULL_46_14]|uniref:Uncharacterized protein n=1 Tax=Candidatus Kaiserbacteria bacterium RIFOXYB1_FULL_46_14 TaxID=1798531 RepID=A0A1F6FJR6_9BACT|nr:MAG: hypothetical protein A2392_01355 [Candidatus Kaiserbacteria bacterium RIFOXYB1_FULL_46_14]